MVRQSGRTLSKCVGNSCVGIGKKRADMGGELLTHLVLGGGTNGPVKT